MTFARPPSPVFDRRPLAQLQSMSSIVIADLAVDSVQAVAKRILRKDVAIRLPHELRWLVSLLEPGLDRLRVPYPVRIEIARHLQPQVVEAGEIAFRDGPQDFGVVVDGPGIAPSSAPPPR